MATRKAAAAAAAAAAIETRAAGVGARQAAPQDADEILGRQRLNELVAQVTPAEKLEPEAVDALLDVADDFVENVVIGACAIARNRGSDALEARDVAAFLELGWDMYVPAAGASSHDRTAPVPARPNAQAIAKHQERLNFIRKLRKT